MEEFQVLNGIIDAARERAMRRVQHPCCFELEEQSGGLVLRAVAICNGTAYKSKEQRLGRNRERLAVALCLHSLTARLITLMHNQREMAYGIIAKRNCGIHGDRLASLGHLWRWIERYGKRVDWNTGNVKDRWADYTYSLRGIICDLENIEPAKASPFYDNYKGKFFTIYTIAMLCDDIDSFPGMIPETMPAEQLSLF